MHASTQGPSARLTRPPHAASIPHLVSLKAIFFASVMAPTVSFLLYLNTLQVISCGGPSLAGPHSSNVRTYGILINQYLANEDGSLSISCPASLLQLVRFFLQRWPRTISRSLRACVQGPCREALVDLQWGDYGWTATYITLNALLVLSYGLVGLVQKRGFWRSGLRGMQSWYPLHALSGLGLMVLLKFSVIRVIAPWLTSCPHGVHSLVTPSYFVLCLEGPSGWLAHAMSTACMKVRRRPVQSYAKQCCCVSSVLLCHVCIQLPFDSDDIQ